MEKTVKWKYPQFIVSCDWLNERQNDKSIRIYDCTTYLAYKDDDQETPYDIISGFSEYQSAHIPNSAFIDIQKHLSKQNSQYSFTLQSFPELKKNFEALGIGEQYHIILYSRNGAQWATRVWWMLFALGVERISILDGGYNEWVRSGLKTTSGINKFEPSTFKPAFKEHIFVGKESPLKGINDNSCILLNSLTRDIHSGDNPRYGRCGRIPKSVNIPFHDFLDTKTGKLKSPKEALDIVTENNIHSNKKIINYCGGGIAATLDAFVLLQLGFENLEIYDNSMSEWAKDKTLPIETDVSGGL